MHDHAAAGYNGTSSLISLEEFSRFAALVRQYAGINLTEQKRQLLTSRLQKRMRALGIATHGEYREYLTSHLDTELADFIAAITTNLTSFFRENHHFDFLATYLRAQPLERPLTIWSAGCSTGEEPYSIAIVVREVHEAGHRVPVRILATDIDHQVVARARRGVYDLSRVENLAGSRLKANFLRGSGANASFVKVKPVLQNLIEFDQLNLLDEWPWRDPIDLIFCRNVVIYFDNEVQGRLFDRFADALRPEGFICIGHSENLLRVCQRYESIGNTIYRRTR